MGNYKYYKDDTESIEKLRQIFELHQITNPKQFKNDFGTPDTFDEWFINKLRGLELKTGVLSREFFSKEFVDDISKFEQHNYINEKYLEEPSIKYHQVSKHFTPGFNKTTPIDAALAAPGTRVFVEFEDTGSPRGGWYGGYIQYNSEDDTLQTWGNMSFNCPARFNHHRGSFCPCCKMQG